MKRSVIVALSLSASPLRRIQPAFRWVVFHHQHVVVPLAGRKALPGVGGELGRMRTAVHPHLALLLLPLDVGDEPDHLLRRVVVDRRDAQVADAAEAVGGGVRLALMFGQRQQRGVPRLRAQTLGIRDRQPAVVADFRSGDAFDLVFVKDRRPDAREIDLR
jgi:hypothetical protein